MNFDDVAIGAMLMLAFFCLGWVIVFIARIRLGNKRNRFACQQCGNCCRLRIIPILKSDIKRMERAGLKGFYERKDGEFVMKRKKGRCVFLKNDSCSIYDVRAEVCRNFPFFKQYGILYCRAPSYCPAVEAMQGNARK